MRFLNKVFFFSFCIACLSSCVTGDKKLYTNITDGSKFFLLHTEGIERTMDMAQFVSFNFRDRNYFIIAWVKANENAIEMAFSNELGASVGELSYYGDGKIQFASTVIPRVFLRYVKPEYIIADFQLCFYEPALLAKALEDIGLVLEIQSGNRRVLDGDKVIIDITKTNNTVKLVNHLREYNYTMEGEFFGN